MPLIQHPSVAVPRNKVHTRLATRCWALAACALPGTLWAHAGHALPGQHWHATDALGFIAAAVGALAVWWAARK